MSDLKDSTSRRLSQCEIRIITKAVASGKIFKPGHVKTQPNTVKHTWTHALTLRHESNLQMLNFEDVINVLQEKGGPLYLYLYLL